MSYEIVYDKQFIKTTTGYIPLILTGSNNCYENRGNGKERRARDWSCISSHAINLPETELIKFFKGWCGGTHQQHFKSNGKWVDDEGLMRFVKAGIKNARTLEEIRELKSGFNLQCQVSVYKDKDYANKPELCESIETTRKLEDWIYKAKERLNHIAENEKIYLRISYWYNDSLRLGSCNIPAGKVIALYKNKHYISAYRDKGITFSLDKAAAFVFDDAEHLKRELKDWLPRIRIIKAGQIREKIEKFVIHVNSNNYKNVFVQRKTRSRLRFSYTQSGAKKFPTKKQAEKYIDGLKQFDCEFSVVEIEKAATA